MQTLTFLLSEFSIDYLEPVSPIFKLYKPGLANFSIIMYNEHVHKHSFWTNVEFKIKNEKYNEKVIVPSKIKHSHSDNSIKWILLDDHNINSNNINEE